MKTFLINYILKISEYMEDGSKKENRSILVEADDEDKAKKTLEAYWDKKSDSYGRMYQVWDTDVVPTISQKDFII